MTIQALSNSAAQMASVYRLTKSEPTDLTPASPPASGAVDTKSLNPQQAAQQIMSHYDLRHISYEEMADLGRELVAAGALPEDRLLDFIPLPSGQIAVDGTYRAVPDAKMDMIARQEDLIASQKAFDLKTAYSTMVLNLYKNFQALHAQS